MSYKGMRFFKRKAKLQLTCPHCDYSTDCVLVSDDNTRFINALRGMKIHATKVHKHKYRKYPIITVL